VQGGQLAAAQAGVDRGRPQGTIPRAVEPADQCLDLPGGREPGLPAIDSGDADPGGRVRVHLAELTGTPVDRLQRGDRVRDRGGGQSIGGQPVHEPLQLRQRDLAQSLVAERVQDTESEVAFVAADRGRLVHVARAVAHDPGASGGQPVVGGLAQCRAAVGAERAGA
jgi:hypothetical protein